jgi:hypothetical protein
MAHSSLDLVLDQEGAFCGHCWQTLDWSPRSIKRVDDLAGSAHASTKTIAGCKSSAGLVHRLANDAEPARKLVVVKAGRNGLQYFHDAIGERHPAATLRHRRCELGEEVAGEAVMEAPRDRDRPFALM